LLRSGEAVELVAAARSWGGDNLAKKRELATLAEATLGGGGKRPCGLHTVELDVSNEDFRYALPSTLSLALKNAKLDVLVNNAAVFPQGWDARSFELALSTNTLAPLRIAQDVSEFGSGRFHVVNVTSGMGKQSSLTPEYKAALEGCIRVEDIEDLKYLETPATSGPAPAYALSKAALNRGTQILAKEWSGKGRVSAVDPGWCRTDMGGEKATRSPRDGALSILQVVLGSPMVIGTGNIFNSVGGVWKTL